LYDQTRKDEPWNSSSNLEIARTRLYGLKCHMSTWVGPNSLEHTNYIGIAGLGLDAPSLPKSDPRAGVFGYERQTTLADIKDGVSQTLLLAETDRPIASWLSGGPATVRGLDPAIKPYLGSGRQFGGPHPGIGGANVAMADGSVRWIRASIDPKVLEACSTIAGREKLPADWWE
jgi:prepilin-type processing-associated H-X9-DG protein